MTEIGVRDLKIRASEIVRSVRERRARYTITYRGRPIGVLLPLDEAPSAEASGESAWDELLRLGEVIGRDWQTTQTSAELLSEMRR
ncbi:MAG: type II toxin-antitoxin system Phd/YefM family antitoxin [Anaerolineae bacterium]|nr:type II toxin-antitoxin system Phd/YefM family antitoxin [Anaerolineae bacterium]